MESANRKYADAIKKIIAFLKGKKISQQEIESRLNYTSLSKAKNFDRYPQVIIEKKSREELFKDICLEFSLKYIEADDSIEIVKENQPNSTFIDIEYYVMHYYAFSRQVTDRELVQIINKRKVIVDNYTDEEHWEGVFSVIENYTFMELTKMGYTTPIKKLLCIFSGTMKYGRPILLGTYGTVKRDGYPAAGKVVLERADSREEAQKLLDKKSDHRIRGYLRDNVFLTRTFTPTTLDELSFNHSEEYMKAVGQYKFYYPDLNNQWVSAPLNINPGYSARIELNGVKYKGSISSFNSDSLSIRFRRRNMIPSEPTAHLLKVEINLRERLGHAALICAGSSPFLHVYPSSFSCYLLPIDVPFEDIKGETEHQLFIAKKH